MRDERRTETKAEARALGSIALVCYSATLAAMLTGGYALLALALRAAAQDFAALLNPSGL